MNKTVFFFTLILLCSFAYSTDSIIKSKNGDTTIVSFAGKQIQLLPTIKEMVFTFKELSPTKIKYDLSFRTGEKPDTTISYKTSETCKIEKTQVVCGTIVYNFDDMNEYKFELQKTLNGFDLIILDLKPNTDYFIDPFIAIVAATNMACSSYYKNAAIRIDGTTKRFMLIGNKIFASNDSGTSFTDFNYVAYSGQCGNGVFSYNTMTGVLSLAYRDMITANTPYFYRECNTQLSNCDTNNSFSPPINIIAPFQENYFGDAGYIIAKNLAWSNNRLYFAYPVGAGGSISNIQIKLLYADGNQQAISSWIDDGNIIGNIGTYDKITGFSLDTRDDNVVVATVVKRNANTYSKIYYSVREQGVYSYQDQLVSGTGTGRYLLPTYPDIRVLYDDTNYLLIAHNDENSTNGKNPTLTKINFNDGTTSHYDMNTYAIDNTTDRTDDPMNITIDGNNLAFIAFQRNGGAGTRDKSYLNRYRYTTNTIDNNVTLDDANVYLPIQPIRIGNDGKLSYFYVNSAGGLYWQEGFDVNAVASGTGPAVPTINNINYLPISPLTIGQTITITPIDLNDSDQNKLAFYCDENGATPTQYISLCSEADTNYTYPYSTAKCSYPVPTTGTVLRTISCRAFDGANYSLTVTKTYSTDNNAPTITIFDRNTTQIKGFKTTPDYNGSVSISCNDVEATNLSLVVSVNDINYLSGTFPKNITQTRDANFVSGTNTIKYYCSDTGNTTILTQTFTVYVKRFTLVDEETGAYPSPNDFNSLMAFTIDKDYDFNMTSIAMPTIDYYSLEDDTITFEILYKDNLNQKIIRSFGLSAMDENNITVCVPKFQQFYEQILYSSQRKRVAMKNNATNCYLLADYTKYAYQNGLSIRAITIAKSYFIYTWINGAKTLLTLIDGQIASPPINLDALEFNKQLVSITVGTDAVSFVPFLNSITGAYDTNILQIYFKSFDNDYNTTNMKIYNGTTILYNITQDANANDFLVLWNWSAYNLTDQNLLKLVITGTKGDGSTITTTEYFNVSGQSFLSDKNPTFIAIMAILFFLFGLTITTVGRTFGWLGLVMCIISMAITFFALPGLFWIGMIQGGLFICFLYILLNGSISSGGLK